jgi:hypothetical protein
MELNGGSVVAMVGKECVAIACDLRLGNQALTVACNFEKVRSPPSLSFCPTHSALFEVRWGALIDLSYRLYV